MAIPGMSFGVLRAMLFCLALADAPFYSARAALLPHVPPGDAYMLGSAVGNASFLAS